MLTEEIKTGERLGVLPVSAVLLEQMFCLPEGHKIVGVTCHKLPTGHSIIRFVLASDAFPEVQEGAEMSQLELHVSVEYLSEYPGYRRLSTDVHLIEQMG